MEGSVEGGGSWAEGGIGGHVTVQVCFVSVFLRYCSVFSNVLQYVQFDFLEVKA